MWRLLTSFLWFLLDVSMSALSFALKPPVVEMVINVTAIADCIFTDRVLRHFYWKQRTAFSPSWQYYFQLLRPGFLIPKVGLYFFYFSICWENLLKCQWIYESNKAAFVITGINAKVHKITIFMTHKRTHSHISRHTIWVAFSRENHELWSICCQVTPIWVGLTVFEVLPKSFWQ